MTIFSFIETLFLLHNSFKKVSKRLQLNPSYITIIHNEIDKYNNTEYIFDSEFDLASCITQNTSIYYIDILFIIMKMCRIRSVKWRKCEKDDIVAFLYRKIIKMC